MTPQGAARRVRSPAFPADSVEKFGKRFKGMGAPQTRLAPVKLETPKPVKQEHDQDDMFKNLFDCADIDKEKKEEPSSSSGGGGGGSATKRPRKRATVSICYGCRREYGKHISFFDSDALCRWASDGGGGFWCYDCFTVFRTSFKESHTLTWFSSWLESSANWQTWEWHRIAWVHLRLEGVSQIRAGMITERIASLKGLFKLMNIDAFLVPTAIRPLPSDPKDAPENPTKVQILGPNGYSIGYVEPMAAKVTDIMPAVVGQEPHLCLKRNRCPISTIEGGASALAIPLAPAAAAPGPANPPQAEQPAVTLTRLGNKLSIIIKKASVGLQSAWMTRHERIRLHLRMQGT